MRIMMNQGKYLLSAVALAGLAACGGGGSGDDGQITVSLAGTASKGLLQNALVEAFAVKDGVVGTTSVASVRTDNDGKYTITNLKGPKGTTYVLKVSAVKGTTKHLDELQGEQTIDDFSMRSVVTPTLSTATPLAVNITPFSEMVVAAAGRKTDGLTDANLTQAKTTIKDLVKFDPISTDVVLKTDAWPEGTSSDSKAQQLYLTAIAGLIQSQSQSETPPVPCDDGVAPLQCVVGALSDAADATTLKLEITNSTDSTNSANLGQLLSAQVASLVDESGSFNGDFSDAEIDELKKPLDCQDDACTPVAPLSDQIANAVTNAKNIFTQLKTDVTSLISSGGVIESATGPANQQAFKFQQSFKDAKPVLDMAFKDVGLMIMGMDLYRNYQRTGEIGVQDMRDNLNTVNVWGPEYGGACGLYETTDVTTRVLNTETQTAKHIGCSAKYLVREDRYYYGDPYTRQEWRHSFWITPDASGPGFSYVAKVNLVTFNCDATGNNTGCVREPDEDLVTDDAGKAVAFTGTGSIALNSAGQATAASLSGDLPPGFTGSDFFDASVTPAIQAGVAKYVTQLNVSLARDANGRVNQVTGSGSFDGLDANGARYAKLSVADVVVKGVESATTGDMVFDSAAGELTFETADAKLQGSMALSAPETDRSGHIAPTRMSFTGGLSTMADGVTIEFLSGRLDLSLGGWAEFNTNQALTASNHYTVDVDFTGSLTAPERPKLELNLTTTGVADGSDTPMDSMTLRYRSIDQGVATQEITVTFADLKTDTPTITMSELASGLRLTRTGSDADAQLLVGDSGEKVGTAKNGMLYFSDGSFMSMDFGI